jgi:hypothetical protein
MVTVRLAHLVFITAALVFNAPSVASSQSETLLVEKLEEPAFASFYHGIRRCVMSTRPDCLTQYLDPTFSFSPWWEDGNRQLRRAEFARFAWRTTPQGSKESFWQSIAWVFLRGQLREIDGGVRFVRGSIECRAYEVKDVYLVTSCDSRE